MVFVNASDKHMLIAIQIGLGFLRILPPSGMEKGRVRVRRTTTSGGREQSHNDKGAELVPTCGHWEMKPPALTFTGYASHKTC